ncbi:MAG TPA: glycosyltransferase family 2 protein [Geminicoccaceae bacterium]|nr:glycosyltransferase family 2 protein [Geminicoccaceae bacterium]
MNPQERMAGSGSGGFRLSLVAPIYNEEAAILSFFARVAPIAESITADYEIVCINDGSTDGTLAILETVAATDPRIKVVDLTRRFGKECALTAGLDFASGDAVIPLDADLQDPPELIPELVEKWRAGNDMVLAVRRDRSSDTRAKRGFARLFYRVIGRLGEVPIPDDAGDFRLLDRRVVEAIKLLPERTRFMKGIFAWLGFRQATITYVRPRRVAGVSKWRAWTLWNFALEGITSFSTLPLRVWTYGGLLVALGAFAYMIVIIWRTLVFGRDVPGYPSLISILLFFSGVNMIGLGIMGEYLGRVFIEVKRRPLYLVRQTIGFATPPEAPQRRERHD